MERTMAEIPIDLRSSHRVEDDGSHTVMVCITGLPSMDAANRVSLWMRDAIRDNAHKIGWRDPNPPMSS
jgi:hypothetical protein